ncbi:MAG: hypothetical protein Q8O67_08370 [Deltaproteobacteria bacterium]|nr:hypothetical protein [Deltaproteobacteria bacterium]
MPSLLPAPLAAFVEKQFLKQLVSTPRGRATLLSQVARSEGTDGETGVFEHILRSIDDDEVLKLVRVHQADEAGHEQLFLARAAAQGAAPLVTPKSTDLLARLDKHTGFHSRPVKDRHGVFQAYLLLQVLEERALRQFDRMMEAFAAVDDDDTVKVFAEVKADEARHLLYCHAITKRYAPSEAARREGLEMMRRLEAEAFEETQRANFHVFVAEKLVDGPLWRFLLGKVEQRFGTPDLSMA